MRMLTAKQALIAALLLVWTISLLTHPHVSASVAAPTGTGSSTDTNPPVQLFDMKTQRIVKTFPNHKSFQAEAGKWLTSVTGPSPQLTIGHQCGYIVRVPLMKAAKVVLPGETVQVKSVFLIYCPEKEPLLLIFSKERKPYLLQVDMDVKPFMQQLLTYHKKG